MGQCRARPKPSLRDLVLPVSEGSHYDFSKLRRQFNVQLSLDKGPSRRTMGKNHTRLRHKGSRGTHVVRFLEDDLLMLPIASIYDNYFPSQYQNIAYGID